MVRIIVRPVAGTDTYEILAGHNRTSAARLAGWTVIPAEIVAADDARAVVIATSTNLIQRQNLSITERGKAYKALLAAKNRNGQRDAARRPLAIHAKGTTPGHWWPSSSASPSTRSERPSS